MRKRKTLGNIEVILEPTGDSAVVAEDVVTRQRQMLADLCKSLGGVRQQDALRADTQQIVDTFTPRQRQTLERLIVGDSEKQIARQLGVSANTVHVYVKAIYRAFDVNSRGELMTYFISPQWQPN